MLVRLPGLPLVSFSLIGIGVFRVLPPGLDLTPGFTQILSRLRRGFFGFLRRLISFLASFVSRLIHLFFSRPAILSAIRPVARRGSQEQTA